MMKEEQKHKYVIYSYIQNSAHSSYENMTVFGHETDESQLPFLKNDTY